jgi:hypothetical protein
MIKAANMMFIYSSLYIVILGGENFFAKSFSPRPFQKPFWLYAFIYSLNTPAKKFILFLLLLFFFFFQKEKEK